MVSDLIIALEKLNENPIAFERLAADILEDRGYRVNKSTEGVGSDGGKDMILERGDEEGVGHVSAAEDWAGKIDADLSTMDSNGDEPDFVVFLTNQAITPPVKEEKKENEIEQEYGWDATIISQGTLRTTLATRCPESANEHLGVNPKSSEPDPLDKIEERKKERIEKIKARQNLPNELSSGACVVLHLFPLGMFSMDYGVVPLELPSPPYFGNSRRGHGDPTGDGKVSYNGEPRAKFSNYTYISEEGYIEAVATEHFKDNRNSPGEPNGFIDFETGRAVGNMLAACVDCLDEIGARPPIYAYISLIDVDGYMMDTSFSPSMGVLNPRPFPEDFTPKYSEIADTSSVSIESLRPTLDRIWYHVGRKNGSPHLENRD